MAIKLRRRRLPSGKVQLFLVTNQGGKRHYESLDLFLTGRRKLDAPILQVAEAIRSKRDLDLHAGNEGVALPWKRGVSIYDFAAKLIANKTKITKATYENALVHLRAFAGDNVAFAQITESFCSEFRDYLITHMTRRNSGAAYFWRFKGIIRYAVKEGYLQRNPSEGLTIHTVDSLPTFLTYEEIMKLVQTACNSEVIKDAFLFAINTGLRHKDVKDLTWVQEVGEYIEFTQSKTQNAERLPLTPSAVAILNRQPSAAERLEKPETLVFPLPRHSTVYKVLNTWARHAGLTTELSFHKARHSFATLMMSHEVDIYTVSKLLGHKSVATTQIYTRVIDSKRKEAVYKLPPIGGLQFLCNKLSGSPPFDITGESCSAGRHGWVENRHRDHGGIMSACV